MRSPNLPGLYELIEVERTDSARAYAERCAAEGADEGTVVWVRKQTRGPGKNGRGWISGDMNFHCAIILRPEEPFEKCCEIGLVAALGLFDAISNMGEPLAELRLAWPGDVFLNRGKLGAARLSGRNDDGGKVNWMILSVDVNTSQSPAGLGHRAASMKGEGFDNHEPAVLLEGFSRAFLSWLNRWADQGLAPILKAWRWRGDWGDGESRIASGPGGVKGTPVGLDDNGALKLKLSEGIMKLSLLDFYRPDFKNV